MRYQDLDWNAMWREERQHKSRPRRNRREWDRRAADFATRNLDSPYTDQFLAKFAWQPHWTVLDAGCGPGTLALPLARRVQQVSAVDYSAAMLAELDKQKQSQELSNIRTVQAAWEDDWAALGLEPHDVVIASRSLAVDNLAGALAKMDRYSRRLAIIGDRVGAGPFDPELFAALGRPFDPGPDYIYTINILYRLGIHAGVDFIILDHERIYPDRQRAIDSLLWMIPAEEPLSAEEQRRLEEYADARLHPKPDGTFALRRDTPSKWALIHWEKSQACALGRGPRSPVAAGLPAAGHMDVQEAAGTAIDDLGAGRQPAENEPLPGFAAPTPVQQPKTSTNQSGGTRCGS
ncbi:class I SAM-dependent methyltransferase [Desulfurivibrio dismutans]|uniref:class I SAM-dependent methyltransferase n=1 Tax=Desulfurivibrio dismutans TaxID=1398908 RepID=UPI0023DA0128|nr:class I SAM-dependent methyltransferase [Desulfurivibrio alkaliphilus]MDF1615402.1 class I SAM-dependent methyltransferase [Desulfurivibrio alkaliphilus]